MFFPKHHLTSVNKVQVLNSLRFMYIGRPVWSISAKSRFVWNYATLLLKAAVGYSVMLIVPTYCTACILWWMIKLTKYFYFVNFIENSADFGGFFSTFILVEILLSILIWAGVFINFNNCSICMPFWKQCYTVKPLCSNVDVSQTEKISNL